MSHLKEGFIDSKDSIFMVNMDQGLIFTAQNPIEQGLAENEGFMKVSNDAAWLFKDAYESGMLSDWVKSKNGSEQKA